MKLDVDVCGHDELKRGSLSHLLELLWSPDSGLNERHLAWKYEKNPYPGSVVYVARAGERIVAMRGFFGARYVTADGIETPRVQCSGDLVIAPDFRSRGVVTQIMARALDDLASRDVGFLLSFSANPAVRLGSLAAGWGTTQPAQVFRRPDPSRSSRGAISRRLERLASPYYQRLRSGAAAALHSVERSHGTAGAFVRDLTRWAPFESFDSITNRDGVVSTMEPRPAAMADLLRRVETDGRIRQLRDDQYFQWRFGSPMNAYRFLFLGGSSLDAYLVLQARYHPMHGKAIRIADWAGVGREARGAVLSAAVAALPRGQINVWTSSLGDDEKALLRSKGFDEVTSASAGEYPPAVLCLPVTPPAPQRPWMFGGRDMLDIGNWNLRLLDSDGC